MSITNSVILGLLLFTTFGYCDEKVSRQSFPNCPPVNQLVNLSSRTQVELPLCFKNSKGVGVGGTANLDGVNKLLAAYHLFAVPVDGQAYLQLYANEYESTIGNYREAMINVIVSHSENIWGGKWNLAFFYSPSIFERIAQFALKLWVDSRVALKLGNEIWGFNKTMARISVNNGFEIVGDSGVALRANWAAAPQKKTLGKNLRYGYYSPGNSISPGKHFFVRSKINTRMEDLSGDDTFQLGFEDSFGVLLRDLNFTPTEKISFSSQFSVFREID